MERCVVEGRGEGACVHASHAVSEAFEAQASVGPLESESSARSGARGALEPTRISPPSFRTLRSSDPESITTTRGYGFRVHALRACPGMTAERIARAALFSDSLVKQPALARTIQQT